MKRIISFLLSALTLSLATVFSANTQHIHAESPQLLLSNTYAEENSLTTITASLNSEICIAAFSISLYFDPSMLEFVDASFSKDYGNFYFGDSDEDCVTIVWSDSKDTTLNNELFTMRFKTKNNTAGCTIPINIGHVVFGNTITNEFPIDVKGCEIIITEDYKWGDANCDGSVSISDVVKILLFSIDYQKYPMTEAQLLNSDINNNNIVDSNDAGKILNYIIKP